MFHHDENTILSKETVECFQLALRLPMSSRERLLVEYLNELYQPAR